MFTDGLWIAVGYNEILTSGDGIHWTNRFVPASEAEDSLFLALARGNGVFAAAGILYANGDGVGKTRRYVVSKGVGGCEEHARHQLGR